MRLIGLAVVLTLGLTIAPLAAEGEQAGKVYRVGALGTHYNPTSDVFPQSLRELGYEEGRNLVIEYRWHEGKFDRLPAIVAELVRLKPDVIFVTGPQPTAAVKAATMTIPIVFAIVADPVGLGLVASLARPGGMSPASPRWCRRDSRRNNSSCSTRSFPARRAWPSS
jgi:putative tryptophan/tyrosine transport system substrate-binding protein